MPNTETRGAVIESLADMDPARDAAQALRTQILENLAQYHPELQHNLVNDFPVQFIEIKIANRSQKPLIHPSIPMVIVYDSRIIHTEGFSKFQAVQEGSDTPFITIYRNTIHQAAYLQPIQAYETYTLFDSGLHITNTAAVNETTQWLSTLGVFVYKQHNVTPWDKEYRDSQIFPVIIPTDQTIGINPRGWLWTKHSLEKRRLELENAATG